MKHRFITLSFSNHPPSSLVLTRHGDRTPLTRVPNDDSVWTCTENSLGIYDQSRAANASPARLFRQIFANGEYLNGNCNFGLFDHELVGTTSCFLRLLWVMCAGQLTQLGSAQHVELGQALRSIYVDHYGFLGCVPSVCLRCFVLFSDRV
jgi:hypothetical protein